LGSIEQDQIILQAQSALSLELVLRLSNVQVLAKFDTVIVSTITTSAEEEERY